VNLNDIAQMQFTLKEMPKYLLVKKVLNIQNTHLNFTNLNQDLIPILPLTVSISVKPNRAQTAAVNGSVVMK
jgi:hypothetical protein